MGHLGVLCWAEQQQEEVAIVKASEKEIAEIVVDFREQRVS